MSLRQTVARFAQLRRGLPLTAAGLLVGALLVPVWRITLTAPQYTRDLVVNVYAYPRLSGDFREVQGLNHYAGFYFPDPVYVDPNYAVHQNAIATPEWILGPVGLLVLAGTGVFVAFAPTVRKLKLGLTCQLIGTLTIFTVIFGIIQYRLHQAGHALDPDAPLRGISGFTPTVLGSYEVANISGFAWFGPGGYMILAAIGLLTVAYLFRDSAATVGDLPGIVRQTPQTLKRWIGTLPDRLPGRCDAPSPTGRRDGTTNHVVPSETNPNEDADR